MGTLHCRHVQFATPLGTKNMIERIWARAVRKRIAEQDARWDEQLTRLTEAHQCTADYGPVLCGAPLDDDGLCEVHQ